MTETTDDYIYCPEGLHVERAREKPLTEGIRNDSPLIQIAETPFYPSDAILSFFAVKVYKNEEIEKEGIAGITQFGPDELASDELSSDELAEITQQLQNDWKLHSWAKNENDDYFGATFYNDKTNQLVIAHRGTKPNFEHRPTVYADLEIARNLVTPQICSASAYCADVLKEARNAKFSSSFTGHSLGAYLAQTSTFTSEYLEMDENGKFEKKNRDPSYQIHTVVLDPPGSHEMLSLLSNIYYNQYGEKADNLISALDITIYFNMPNAVNCYNSHNYISRVFQIFKKNEVVLDCSNKNIATHNKENFLIMLMSGNYTKLTVQNWPSYKFAEEPDKKSDDKRLRFRHEITRLTKLFIDAVNTFVVQNNELDSFLVQLRKLGNTKKYYEKMKLEGSIAKCSAVECDEKTRRVSAFSTNELNFLKIFKEFQRQGLTPKKLEQYLEENSLPTFENLLMKKYEIEKDGNKNFYCEDVEKLINQVKHYLYRKPEMYEKIKEDSDEVPTICEAHYKSSSRHYIRSTNLSKPKYDIEFNDTINLGEFLETNSKNLFCLCTGQDTINEVFRIWKLLQDCGKKYKQYFWDLMELNELGGLTNIVNNFKRIDSECAAKECFVIDCKTYDDSNDTTIVQNLIKAAKETKNGKKLIVVVSSKDAEWYKGDKDIDTGSGYSFIKDFTSETQKKLMELNVVTLKDEKMNLLNFLGLNIETDRIKFTSDVLEFLSEPNVIHSLIEGELEKNPVELCSENIVNVDDMKIRSFKIYQKIDKDRLTKFVQQENDLKKMILFAISDGGSGQDLKKILHSEIHFDIIKLLTEDCEDFYKFCRQEENIEKKIYWLHIWPDSIELREVYDSDFYVDRYFYPQILLKDKSFEEVIKAKPTSCEFKLSVRDNKKSSFENFPKVHVINNWVADFNEESTIENKSQHTLLIENPGGKLIWISSSGSIDQIRKMASTDKEKVVPESVFEQKKEKVVIIEGEPGMGKSSTLLNIAARMEKTWVLWISCISIGKDIFNLSNDKMDKIVKFLQKTNKHLTNPLIESMLRYGLSKKSKMDKIPIVLFIDGFDEADKEIQKEMIEILKCTKEETNARMWITTRAWAKYELEDALLTFAVEMKEISGKEQLKLITNIWQSRLICLEKSLTELIRMSKKLINHVNKVLMHDREPLYLRSRSTINRSNIPRFVKKCLEEESLSKVLEELNLKELNPKIEGIKDSLEENVENFVELTTPETETLNNFLKEVNELAAGEIFIIEDHLKMTYHGKSFWENKRSTQIVIKVINILELFRDYNRNEIYFIRKSDPTKSLIGIPLQLRIIAEISQPEIDSNGTHKSEILFKDLFSMYKKSISKKVKIHFHDKLRKQYNRIDEEARIKKHECLGFQVLFPDLSQQILDDDEVVDTNNKKITREIGELNGIGLVKILENGKVQFIHHSFTEFCAAQKILRLMQRMQKNWSNPRMENFLMDDILQNKKYKVIRRFLNDYLKSSRLEKNPLILKFLQKENAKDIRVGAGALATCFNNKDPLRTAMKERNDGLSMMLIDSYGCINNLKIDKSNTCLSQVLRLAYRCSTSRELFENIVALKPVIGLCKITVRLPDTSEAVKYAMYYDLDLIMIWFDDNIMTSTNCDTEVCAARLDEAIKKGTLKFSTDLNLAGFLLRAIYYLQSDTITKILKDFPDECSRIISDEKDDWGKQYLHAAIRKDKRAVVEALLNLEADANGVWEGKTPLLAAVSEERWDIAEYLIDRGASDNDVNNIIELATKNSRTTIISKLLKKRG